MASVCNVWKSQPTNWTWMSLLWFALILTVKKMWFALYNRNLHDYVYVYIPPSLRFRHLCNCETRQLWRRTPTGNPSEFSFLIFNFPLNPAKKWSNTENLNETVKHWKQSENKYLKMSYMACYWVCLLMGG